MHPDRSLRVATVRGVDVHIAPSWLVIAIVVVVSYQRTFTADDRSVVTAVAMGLVTAVLFTASVLAHELAHALEGTHRGVEVGGITLFLLGGATSLRDPDRRAGDEFAIAAIGPWSNVVLAAVFGLLATAADGRDLAVVADVAGLLGWLNLGLAAFNLVPGAPLDGGRILRAAIWAVTGERHRSTVAAAWLGVLLGLGLVAVAAWLVGARSVLWGGLWVGVIGGYVLRAARMELARGRLALWLSDLTAGELAPAAPRLAVDAPVAELVAVLDDSDVVLLDDGGEPAGLVTSGSDDVRPGTEGRAGDHARALDDLPLVRADGTGDRLVGLLDRDQPYVLVAGPHGTWLSSLGRIDDRIQELRGRGVPDEVAP